MSGSRPHKAPASRAGNRPRSLSPSVPCPAAVATTNLNLTHKPPECQSAGEGDAQEFILRFFSLTPLCSAPSVGEAAAGTCVLEISLPSLASPRGRGRVEGRQKQRWGFPKLTRNLRSQWEPKSSWRLRPSDSSDLGHSSPPFPKPELLCPILAKFLRGKGGGLG